MQTVLLSQQMPRFQWNVSMVKSESNVRYPTESVKQISSDEHQWGAPVYHAAAGSQTSSVGNKSGGSVGHKIYMQLMNGVSHMLPLVVGGGILIAIAFLIDGLSVDLSALPADQRANFGTITPVAALFKGIGGTAFGFMLPILAGFIAMAIGDRPGTCTWSGRRYDGSQW